MMRLLNVNSFELRQFQDADRPLYVIASHRWLDNETTFRDVLERRNTDSDGYRKVEAFATYIRRNLPHVRWLWIDTCCINKDSDAELSEAINSMFDWYHDAELCLAYLIDVATVDEALSFQKSKWFTRGWTLQELVAPRLVLLLIKDWQVIGHKGDRPLAKDSPSFGPNLERILAQATSIPEHVLHNYGSSLVVSEQEKWEWMEGRETTRPEDRVYALFGLFGVTLSVIYGEKYDKAKERLLAELHQRVQRAAEQAEHYRKITDWLSPPDPWKSHEQAHRQREPDTGAWLLRGKRYTNWKDGSGGVLWIHGKAGCGKTILCSTAIEDVRLHCRARANIEQAIFYFSFSDTAKQTYRSMVVSLLAQLAWRDPALSMLRQAYEQPTRQQPGLTDLQSLLLCAFASHEQVLLHLDALDECPQGEGVRSDVLRGIKAFIGKVSNVRMLVTSRDELDIRQTMEGIDSTIISIADQTVDADIRKYVAAEISRIPRLSRLNPSTKENVASTLSKRAHGMFRWVSCQLQELKNSRSTRPKSILAALEALPKDLDETYERMLMRISDEDRPYALALLQWIAYAMRPLTLAELSEAAIVDPTDDPTADGIVESDNKGDWADALEILAGLVTTVASADATLERPFTAPDVLNEDNDSAESEFDGSQVAKEVQKETEVRLAHFSVKEYLESTRILSGDARFFHLDPTRGHTFLTQSSLVYITYYSEHCQDCQPFDYYTTFPLLQYAVKWWYHHAKLQKPGYSFRTLSLLGSTAKKRAWLFTHNRVDTSITISLESSALFGDLDISGGKLYFASLLGLEEAVAEALTSTANVDALGGYYGSALHAASAKGYDKIIERLLAAGADVHAQGGYYGTPLQAASANDFEKTVERLLAAGANVDAVGGNYGTALQAASEEGYEKIIERLLAAGADVHAQGGYYGTALQAASAKGFEGIVERLLAAGADVHAQGSGHYGTALQAASEEGFENIVKILLAAGAES